MVDRLDPALAPAVVANVPIGLALFASLTSQVGDGLTRLTEQAFTLPDDLAYRRHGLIFGVPAGGGDHPPGNHRRGVRAEHAQLCEAVRVPRPAARATSRRTISGKVDRYLVPGHRRGHALGRSLARAHVRVRDPAGRRGATGATPIDREIVTCQVGAGRLNAQWNAEIARAGTVFGRRIFPGSRTEALARAELLAALPAAHDFLIGAARSAGEIMRQQMVLNAVHDAGEQWAAEAGNAAALQAYTEARAEAQTVSAYRAIGRQAETWVPLLKIVFECLYIGAFPMAVLLMLTPAGGGDLPLLRHRADLAPVLGAALRGAAPHLHGRGRRAHAGCRDHARRRYRHFAGGTGRHPRRRLGCCRHVGLSLDVGAIPRCCARLRPLQGDDPGDLGAGGRTGRGKSSAAHEGTTGNLSLANTGYDTHRFATMEGRQIRTSAHVDTDRYTGYAPAGAGMTVTGDGTVVTDAGAATSRIPAAGVQAVGVPGDQPRATGPPNRAASRATGWRRRARQGTPPSPTRRR